MPTIFFDMNALYIEGYRDSFVAGSLVADFTPIGVGVRVRHGTDYLVNDIWQVYSRQDGSKFASGADLMAYLTAQFEMRRSLDLPAAVAVATSDMPAGMPVTVSRRDGSLLIARADTYALAFVAGLASAGTAAGFAGAATRNALTLADWTAVTGSPTLAVGLPYFLAPAGGLTLDPPTLPGYCSVRVGNATSTQTFAPVEADPILL